MEKYTFAKSAAPRENAAVTNRVYSLLGQLEPQQLNELAGYAQYLCRRTRGSETQARYLAVYDGHEIFHAVIADVLTGLSSPNHGRHPRPDDLVDMESFCGYLRGAIRSKHSTLAAHTEAITDHVALDATPDDLEVAYLRDGASPAQIAEYADVTHIAFAALRRQVRATGSVVDSLTTWESNLSHVAKADEVGLTARQFRNLRKRLRRIFRKLGVSPSPHSSVQPEVSL